MTWGRGSGNGGSRGTVATETDMAETFKMHVPLEGDESGSTL